MRTVNNIIEDVKQNGDKAVKRYTEIFDKTKIKNLEVNKIEIKEAYKKIDKKTLRIIKSAAANIKKFAKEQFNQFKNFEYTKDGITIGQRIIPIEKVGVYIPGGRYPLPSTALMCIIPAKIVGVKNIIICSPKIKPETIVASHFAGADLIFRVGGVQAIAAMAYGTETIPRVDKIFGPGNTYVTQAKKEIYGDCGIDFLAGPSEILIIADKWANPVFIAADLLAQAEHDVNAKLIFITDTSKLIKKVKKELKIQLNKIATKKIAEESLKKKKIIKVKNLEEAIKKANKLAPEHLMLQIKNPKRFFKKLKNYGSLFLGDYSAVVFGDYCSGINHVLPTNKVSRYTGGLSVRDFIKIQTYQYITKVGAKKLGKTAIDFASIEGLDAHRKSARVRLK